MKKNPDPKEFNLPPRTVLEQVDRATIAIILDRKSRIIMADGRKIAEKAEQIKKFDPGVQVILKTGAPVCSKTAEYLASQGIKTIYSRV